MREYKFSNSAIRQFDSSLAKEGSDNNKPDYFSISEITLLAFSSITESTN